MCFGFDTTRDDAAALLNASGLSAATAHQANEMQCLALLNNAVDAAIACVQSELTGTQLSTGAQSAAIDVATALGCTAFKALPFVAKLKLNDAKGAAQALAADAFCTADACRCAQNRYCLEPCESLLSEFSAACPVAPGSQLCDPEAVGSTTAAAPVAVDCKYSAWKKSKSCSVACTGSAGTRSGYETWTRTVNDASECSLPLSEERSCSVSCAAANNGGAYGAPAEPAVNAAPNVNAQNNVNGGEQVLNNDEIGAIVGGLLGGLLLVGLIIFFARRRSSGNSKDRGDVYNPSYNAPAVGNPLFADASKSQENPLFSEDSLQKISVAPVPAPIVAAAAVPAVAAVAASSSSSGGERAGRKSRKVSKKKVRANDDDAAELAVCLTCGKEFKDAGMLRLHATSHNAAGGDDDDGGNETFEADGDTFATQAVKRKDSYLDDKPAVAISSQGSVANLLNNDDL